MISKVLSRAAICIASARLGTLKVMAPFARNTNTPTKVETSKLATMVEMQIKSESDNVPDFKESLEEFKKGQWELSHEGIQAELTKTVGKYVVRILGSAKVPDKFDDEEEEEAEAKEKEEEAEDDMDDMTEVVVCITKTGETKTMVMQVVILADNFEVNNIYFTSTYEEIKKKTFKFESAYLGPDIMTIGEDLFEEITKFAEDTLGVHMDLLESFKNYLIDYEHQFYLGWLKDLKSIL